MPVVDDKLVKKDQRVPDQLPGARDGRPLAGGEPRQAAAELLEQIYQTHRIQVEDKLKAQIITEVLDDLIGFGPIQPLLNGPTISEIMVNGYQAVFIERNGELIETGIGSKMITSVANYQPDLYPLGGGWMSITPWWMPTCGWIAHECDHPARRGGRSLPDHP